MTFAKTLKSLITKHDGGVDQLGRQHEIMSRLTERREADSCDMQLIFDELIQAACEGLAVTRVSLWLCNEDFSATLCASSYESAEGLQDIFEEMPVVKCPKYFKAVESGALVVNNDVEHDIRTSELFNLEFIPKNTNALLHLPLWLDKEKIGYLCCDHVGSVYRWQQSDQAFVCTVGHHIAIAMANCRRNRTEKLLKESEQRYELAVNGSSDGLWDWDLSSNKMYRSSQFKKLLGYREDELKDEVDFLSSQLHPDDRRCARVALNVHLADSDTSYEDEFRLQTKSGRYRWFRCRGKALRDEGGKPYRVSGSITDIDDFKYVQRSLNRFKHTLGEVTENIFMFDPDTLKYFYVNKSAINDWGYTEAELISMTPVDIRADETEKVFRSLLKDIISSEKLSLNYETVFLHKNGKQVDVEVNLKYIDPANSPSRFVGVVRDISQRKRADIENYIQRTMLEHISKVQDAFISGEGRIPDYAQLLNVILDITESEFGLVGEVVYPENGLPFIKSRHVTGVSSSAGGQEYEFRDLDTLLGMVVKSSDAVIVNSREDNIVPTGFPEGCPDLESYMGIPLKLGDKLIGMIGIANRREGYKEKIIQQLQPLLSTCANLLDAERAEVLRSSMEMALVGAKEEAERANSAKSDFLSSMSHELRTPLNAIMGFSQLLKIDTRLAEKQKKHAGVIYSAGGLLLELINDVLDLAKIESDHVDLSIESISLDGLLQECFRFIKPMAEKRDIDLILDIGSDGIWVQADNTRLKQVLLNVLSNAIKYNKDAGSVKVSCKLKPHGMQSILIEDRGRGIRPENIGKLFQPFNRLDVRQGEIEGTGIGLVITRKLIELMGGAIQVESEYGRGATFVIDIPVADVKGSRSNSVCSEDKVNLDGSRGEYCVLVAEDNLINQELITLQLHSLGYVSAVVNNGNEAFAELHKNNYDVLLTDIHMPGMGGHKLAKTIRESKYERIKNITIIAITANAANNEAEHCLASGMNDYLAKPISRDDLKEKLERWLPVTSLKNEEAVHEYADSALPQCQSDAVIDMSQLVCYIGEDLSKQEHFFGLFLKTTPESINALHQAHIARSLSDVEFYSHKIKSSAHTLGLIGLSLLCQQLEMAAENACWKEIDLAMSKIDVMVSAVERSIHAYLNAFQGVTDERNPPGRKRNQV